MKTRLSILLAATVAVASTAAIGHGGARHDTTRVEREAAEQKPWGIAGEASAVDRTVTIRMTDAMRFIPDNIEVKRGETVRFVLRNDGRMLHEMVIGTKAVLDEHMALMEKFPDMEHDEPYMAHVGPGRQGEIVWRFNRAGEFDFACLIPGHYQAGMKGRIVVRP
jgi:uncharacterized cupredoxin-like copper-binding protein